ncbi:MAG: anti-sigma factor family protein [Candidatus Zipacnadales bacterium]
MNRQPCQRFEHLLPLYVDEALTEGETSAVRAHLRECPVCHAEVERWRALNRVLTKGLRVCESVSEAETKAAIMKVHMVKPIWRIVPSPVRFWRSWMPVATVLVGAALLTTLILQVPAVIWDHTQTLFREEAATYGAEARDLPEIMPTEFVNLTKTVRTLPHTVLEEITEQWERSGAFSRSITARTGRGLLLGCALVLFAANVLLAGKMRVAHQSILGG